MYNCATGRTPSRSFKRPGSCAFQHPCAKQRQRVQKAEKPGRPIAAKRLCPGILHSPVACLDGPPFGIFPCIHPRGIGSRRNASVFRRICLRPPTFLTLFLDWKNHRLLQNSPLLFYDPIPSVARNSIRRIGRACRVGGSRACSRYIARRH